MRAIFLMSLPVLLFAAPPVPKWFEAGKAAVLPAEATFEDSNGELGVLNTGGSVATGGHPFFDPLGSNGRACVTCHQRLTR
jgi:hypothetical protein